MRTLLLAFFLVAAVAVPAAAHADTLEYTITSATVNGTFYLDTSTAEGGGVSADPIAGATGSFLGESIVQFFNPPSSLFGDLLIGQYGFGGPALYSGPTNAPTFFTGMFSLSGTTVSPFVGPATLDVVDLTLSTPVPEIDAATGMSALSLLVGMVAVARGRKRISLLT